MGKDDTLMNRKKDLVIVLFTFIFPGKILDFIFLEIFTPDSTSGTHSIHLLN